MEDAPAPAPSSDMRARRFGRSAAAWTAAGLLALLVPGVLLANGGTLRLANVVMGEYRVSVFTDPTPVRPDSLDVSVLVLREDVEGVPEDLDVTVRTELLEPAGGSDGGTGGAGTGAEERRATREEADDPRYYAAKFALGAEGAWRITVAVRGDAGEGEAGFEVDARERGLLGHPLAITLLALLPLVAAAWWVLREDPPVDARSR